jgi:hypothetical protein
MGQRAPADFIAHLERIVWATEQMEAEEMTLPTTFVRLLIDEAKRAPKGRGRPKRNLATSTMKRRAQGKSRRRKVT